jgi:hypothetical protein
MISHESDERQNPGRDELGQHPASNAAKTGRFWYGFCRTVNLLFDGGRRQLLLAPKTRFKESPALQRVRRGLGSRFSGL